MHWKDNSSITPLYNACAYGGDVKTVKCLIDAEADVNAKLVAKYIAIFLFESNYQR